MGLRECFYRKFVRGMNAESGVIDPDVTYKFSRRVDRAKTLACGLFILALIVAILTVFFLLLYSNRPRVPEFKLPCSTMGEEESVPHVGEAFQAYNLTTAPEALMESSTSTTYDEPDAITELVGKDNSSEIDILSPYDHETTTSYPKLETETSTLGQTNSASESTLGTTSTTFTGSVGKTTAMAYTPVATQKPKSSSTTSEPEMTSEITTKMILPQWVNLDDGEHEAILEALKRQRNRMTTTQSTTTACPFTCSLTQKCLPLDRKCDGRFDCAQDSGTESPHNITLDRSDELDCPCQPQSFICDQNGTIGMECIHMRLVCDSQEDCRDGKDEKTEACTAVSESLTNISSHQGSKERLEGYVLVRFEGTWHPLCREWSTELGRQICHSFHFKKLLELRTIELASLNRRLGLNLSGRNKFIGEEVESTENYLGVTNKPAQGGTTTAYEEECIVGHIYCTN